MKRIFFVTCMGIIVLIFIALGLHTKSVVIITKEQNEIQVNMDDAQNIDSHYDIEIENKIEENILINEESKSDDNVEQEEVKDKETKEKKKEDIKKETITKNEKEPKKEEQKSKNSSNTQETKELDKNVSEELKENKQSDNAQTWNSESHYRRKNKTRWSRCRILDIWRHT